jgi:hypothetical protein
MINVSYSILIFLFNAPIRYDKLFLFLIISYYSFIISIISFCWVKIISPAEGWMNPYFFLSPPIFSHSHSFSTTHLPVYNSSLCSLHSSLTSPHFFFPYTLNLCNQIKHEPLISPLKLFFLHQGSWTLNFVKKLPPQCILERGKKSEARKMRVSRWKRWSSTRVLVMSNLIPTVNMNQMVTYYDIVIKRVSNNEYDNILIFYLLSYDHQTHDRISVYLVPIISYSGCYMICIHAFLLY